METLVCGMPTVHAPVTASVQSGMPLTALTVTVWMPLAHG